MNVLISSECDTVCYRGQRAAKNRQSITLRNQKRIGRLIENRVGIFAAEEIVNGKYKCVVNIFDDTAYGEAHVNSEIVGYSVSISRRE